MHDISSLATLKLPAYRHHAAIASIHSEGQFRPVQFISPFVSNHWSYSRPVFQTFFHIFISIQAYISSKDKVKNEHMAL